MDFATGGLYRSEVSTPRQYGSAPAIDTPENQLHMQTPIFGLLVSLVAT